MATFVVFTLILIAMIALPAWGLHRYGYWPSGSIAAALTFAFVWALL